MEKEKLCGYFRITIAAPETLALKSNKRSLHSARMHFCKNINISKQIQSRSERNDFWKGKLLFSILENWRSVHAIYAVSFIVFKFMFMRNFNVLFGSCALMSVGVEYRRVDVKIKLITKLTIATPFISLANYVSLANFQLSSYIVIKIVSVYRCWFRHIRNIVC